MKFVIIGVVVLVLFFIVLLAVGGRKISKHNNPYLAEKWSNLFNELNKKGIEVTSQIKIDSINYYKPLNDYLPEIMISIDSKSEKIAISYLNNMQKDKNGFIIACEFKHDILPFDTIIGGELQELGKSSKSFGTAVGSQIGNSPMVGGLTSSSTSNYVDKLEYRIKLNDIDNPEYILVFVNRKEAETSLWYQKHFERAQKFNVIIEQIALDKK